MDNLLPNSLLFTLGSITFLVTYSWFKHAEMEIFKSNLGLNTILDGSSFKLLSMFIVELIICAGGVIGMGNLFILLYDLTPEITLLLTSDPVLECPLANIPSRYL
ncbi:hypothetical protein N9T10_01290 [Pseudomonadota bacterium]|nr:hypothetical protein [Pseudomonadota bacterium]